MTKNGDSASQVTQEEMAYVFHRIRSAVRTLRRVPNRDRASRSTAWPDIVRDFWDCYGYNDPTPPKLVPTAKQITEMDEALGWVAWLARHHGRENARILWARAEGYSLRAIASAHGRVKKDAVNERFFIALYLVTSEFGRK